MEIPGPPTGRGGPQSRPSGIWRKKVSRPSGGRPGRELTASVPSLPGRGRGKRDGGLSGRTSPARGQGSGAGGEAQGEAAEALLT